MNVPELPEVHRVSTQELRFFPSRNFLPLTIIFKCKSSDLIYIQSIGSYTRHYGNISEPGNIRYNQRLPPDCIYTQQTVLIVNYLPGDNQFARNMEDLSQKCAAIIFYFYQTMDAMFDFPH
jgi:hypothetical protein